jgi:nucleotide-binding universal stress UspA family protein
VSSRTESKSVVGAATAIRVDRILCPIDFSDASAEAYRYAQSIACRYSAKLILQHVVELWQHPSCYYQTELEYYEQFRETLVNNAQDQLRQFADLSDGIQPECIVEESMAPDAILCAARSRAINLIIMGTHGRRGFDHLMLGSVTERVLRHAPCPVLAVARSRPDQSARNPAAKPIDVQRILCCVDFSPHSQRALQHAVSVAGAYGAQLTILHVLENNSDSAEIVKETDAAMDKLQRWVAPSTLDPASVHVEVRLGKPYREILDLAAETQSDLIVTGVRGRNSLDLAVFGSTTYRVIQLHPGPVLTVPM